MCILCVVYISGIIVFHLHFVMYNKTALPHYHSTPVGMINLPLYLSCTMCIVSLTCIVILTSSKHLILVLNFAQLSILSYYALYNDACVCTDFRSSINIYLSISISNRYDTVYNPGLL